ncbi:MAG TPA: exclusion protein FxsA, partial [Gammaproteobacteria bacterium]|nr:exclusion protein FxsA [Gammaproteobacteria bacterium]
MLFPVFVVVTLLEIYVLVSVGESIGGFSTILLVIITALIGSTLLKQQGWSTMAKAQNAMANGQTPAFEMMEGVVILISGVLLLTPGFITDAVGLLGLMPWS